MSNADVLASALQDLNPEFSVSFAEHHPLMERVVKGGRISRTKAEGPYKEFVVVQKGPGAYRQIINGDEVMHGQRRQGAVRGSEYAPRVIYYFDVPNIDLAEIDNAHRLAKVIEKYPELAMLEIAEDVAAQLGRGAASAGVLSTESNANELAGLTTFNGDQNYTPKGAGGVAGSRAGIFQFAAPASQTAAVHGLTSEGGANGIVGWYNQYFHISSMFTDGLTKLRQAKGRAEKERSSLEGGVDLMISDSLSFYNYLETQDQKVRTTVVNGDTAPFKARDSIDFHGAEWCYDEAIDIVDTTSFTSSGPQAGVVYMICSNDWEIFTHGSGKKTTDGFFAFNEVGRLQDQDAHRFEIVMHWNIYTTSRRSQAVVTGGAA
jgi:hypothetical protein